MHNTVQAVRRSAVTHTTRDQRPEGTRQYIYPLYHIYHIYPLYPIYQKRMAVIPTAIPINKPLKTQYYD